MVIPSTIECGADAGVFPSTLIGYGAGCGPNVQPYIRLACRVLSSLYKPLQYYIAIDSASFTFPLPFLLVLLFWARLSRFESAIRVRPLFSSPLDQGQGSLADLRGSGCNGLGRALQLLGQETTMVLHTGYFAHSMTSMNKQKRFPVHRAKSGRRISRQEELKLMLS